jgi:hypothetical protein
MTACLGPYRPRPPAEPATDPALYWKRATDLAPDWVAPARDLFRRYAEADRDDDAEAVARRLLESAPQSVTVLDELADLLARGGRADDALAVRTRLLAANPLDRMARMMASVARVAAARRQMIDRRPAAALKMLEEGDRLCRQETPAVYLALRSVVARALRRGDEAEALRAEGEAVEDGRLAVALVRSVDSALAKRPPAERKAVDADLAAALAGPAAPREASLLYAVSEQYLAEGITYRGQKAAAKKVRRRRPRLRAGDPRAARRLRRPCGVPRGRPGRRHRACGAGARRRARPRRRARLAAAAAVTATTARPRRARGRAPSRPGSRSGRRRGHPPSPAP